MRREILLSPISGVVSQILTHSGSKVSEGQEILSLEVMKLYYSVTSGLNGKINLIVTDGEFVQEGQEIGSIVEE